MALSLDEAKDQMRGIKDALHRAQTKIAGDADLHDRGRIRNMAITHLKFMDEAEKVRAQLDDAPITEQPDLRGELFGMKRSLDAAATIVFRDSEDRAALLTTRESATETLRRSLERGDTVMARSVAGHAWSKGWSDIAEEWAAAVGESAKLERLAAISTAGRNVNIVRGVIFGLPFHTAFTRLLGPNVPSRSDLEALAR